MLFMVAVCGCLFWVWLISTAFCLVIISVWVLCGFVFGVYLFCGCIVYMVVLGGVASWFGYL